MHGRFSISRKMFNGVRRPLVASLLAASRRTMASTAGGSGAASGGAKLWGGRFTGKTDPLMEAFNNSIGFDKRLWRADITGSIAYAKALARTGLLTHEEAATLEKGLKMVSHGPQARGATPRDGAHVSAMILTQHDLFCMQLSRRSRRSGLKARSRSCPATRTSTQRTNGAWAS
jgi:hypothetical protein